MGQTTHWLGLPADWSDVGLSADNREALHGGVQAQLRRSAKHVALWVDDLTPVRNGVVALAYHRVGGRTVSPVDLPTATFRRQVDHLKDRVVAIEHGLEIAGGCEENYGPNPVVLTFDDGTADFAEVALPILMDLDLPATLYLSTARVDSQDPYPQNGQPISWNALRDCLSTGLVTIGAHTHNHVLLDRCSVAEAANELDRCDGRIEDELGVRPQHFAYPKAVSASAAVEPLVRVRYSSAAVAGTRPNPIGETNPYRLHRSPIQNADEWEGFVRKADGGMRFEDDVRRTINLIRYRGKTS